MPLKEVNRVSFGGLKEIAITLTNEEQYRIRALSESETNAWLMKIKGCIPKGEREDTVASFKGECLFLCHQTVYVHYGDV